MVWTSTARNCLIVVVPNSAINLAVTSSAHFGLRNPHPELLWRMAR
jgi:hypothetical protein